MAAVPGGAHEWRVFFSTSLDGDGIVSNVSAVEQKIDSLHADIDVFRAGLRAPVPPRAGEVRRDIYCCPSVGDSLNSNLSTGSSVDDHFDSSAYCRFGVKLRGGVGQSGQAFELKVRTGRDLLGVENWTKVLHCPSQTVVHSSDELRSALVEELRDHGTSIVSAAECADLIEKSPTIRRVVVDKARVKLYYSGVFVEQTDLQVDVGGENAAEDRLSRWRTVSIECQSARRIEQFMNGELATFMQSLLGRQAFYVMGYPEFLWRLSNNKLTESAAGASDDLTETQCS